MIFVSTGTQLPFDRLLKAVFPAVLAIDSEVVVQSPRTAVAESIAARPSGTHEGVRLVEHVPTREYDRLFTSAALIIAHAGMGGIVNALNKARPLLVLPRRAELREHRNDHQVESVRLLVGKYPNVKVALTDAELSDFLRDRDAVGALMTGAYQPKPPGLLQHHVNACLADMLGARH